MESIPQLAMAHVESLDASAVYRLYLVKNEDIIYRFIC